MNTDAALNDCIAAITCYLAGDFDGLIAIIQSLDDPAMFAMVQTMVAGVTFGSLCEPDEDPAEKWRRYATSLAAQLADENRPDPTEEP